MPSFQVLTELGFRVLLGVPKARILASVIASLLDMDVDRSSDSTVSWRLGFSQLLLCKVGRAGPIAYLIGEYGLLAVQTCLSSCC